MVAKDSVLSFELGLKDCLYRICRDENGTKRVVYAVRKDLDIIPEESQTYGPEVIRELSKLKEWYITWNALTIYKDETGIQCQRDTFEPHALPEPQILGDYEFSYVLELPILQVLKPRVFRVKLGGNLCFFKIF